MKKSIFLAALFFCVSTAVMAMEITEYAGEVKMVGQIERGDSDKLLGLIKSFKSLKKNMRLISINSLGGDAIEALKLAETIAHLHADIAVDQKGVCASACFFLYLAGDTRSAKGMPKASSGFWNVLSGPVGLHRPYIQSSSNATNFKDEQKIVMRKIGRYLEEKHVPRRLIDEMMSRSSVDVYWLEPNDLREIGKYSPESEELYLARCGRTTDERYKATGPEDPNWRARFSRYLDCIDEQRADLRKDWLSKINNGWYPTNPLNAIP